MNKDIKFRGRTITGEWYYGDLVHESFDAYSRLIKIGIIVRINGHSCYPVEVMPETVGQFTGLKDKNGKEIYEDDIVQRGVIKFYRGKFVGQYYGSGGLYEEWEDDLYQERGIAVIGNIFDNPELLEE